MPSSRLGFVITGPPGSGKSPLVEHLVASGFVGVPEPARVVIAEQRAVDGRAIYDRDRRLFLDLMLSRSLEDVRRHADSERAVFFDRGLPDLIGYAHLFGVDPSGVEAAAAEHRYNDLVFVLPSWPEIYVTDEDRRMTFEDAAAFGTSVRGIYERMGYTLVEVPRATIADRADFIVEAIASRR